MKKVWRKRKLLFSNILNIVVLIVVLVTIIVSVLLVRQKLLQNTQELGMSLAESFAREEEVRQDSFTDFLNFGSQYVDDMYENRDSQDIQLWMQDFFQKMSDVLGTNAIDPYAVIDGKIVAANPWEGDEGYDYRNTVWYQEAVKAGGDIIFTNVYNDAVTNKPIITMAKEVGQEGDVLAMDLYPDRLYEEQNSGKLPDDCSFFLFDPEGTLLVADIPWEIEWDELEHDAAYLLEGIKDGSLVAYDTSFVGHDGKQRGAYFDTTENGWTVVLTIPFDSVLIGEKNVIVFLLAGVGTFFFLALLVMVIKDLLQMKKIRTSENTVRILGDSFYAIYLVDYKKGTYEFIKPSADIASHVPMKGDYNDLLKAIRLYVETDVNEEFEHAFSLEQIIERVKDKVMDYGGDYKRKFNGVYKWVNVRTLYNEKVSPDEVIFCFREVDQEKRQQQQHMLILRDALESARENAKEKEVFFNNVSHDMRTPLNAIIGFSDLVTKYVDDKDKVVDYMGKIGHAGKQLLNLINDILELSRIQSGKNALSNAEFDIEQCIRDSAALFDTVADAQDKKYSIDINIQDKLVYGDSLRLEQILNNLLSNAFKYSNPGDSVFIKVNQTKYMKRSKYEIVVEDTGIGMSEDFTKRIFELYARETSFSTKSISGTGLGMPIVKGLVQQMSGEISVESKLGEGSRFTVTIPFETVNRVEDNKSQKSEETVINLKGRRIILAEDNELNMEIATEILTMNGIEVIPAVNGEEAVFIFKSSALFSIDAILMDMQMPVMDGCEAARTIRALDRDDAKSIPIIAVTANAFAEDIQKTANAGMNGHISKPIDFKILTKTLEELITK